MTKKHSFKDWLIATRPWSFPASAMPVLVTLGYMFWSGLEVDWFIGILTILNVVLFHAAGNTWSDYKDYKSGVDREDTVGGLSIVSGQFTAQEIKTPEGGFFQYPLGCGNCGWFVGYVLDWGQDVSDNFQFCPPAGRPYLRDEGGGVSVAPYSPYAFPYWSGRGDFLERVCAENPAGKVEP